MTQDLPGGEEHATAALALARRWGLRELETFAAGNLAYILTMAGRLEEAHRLGTELLNAGGDERPGAIEINYRLAHLQALRGNIDAARGHISACGSWQDIDDVQYRAQYAAGEAAVSLNGGDSPHTLESARRAMDNAITGGLGVAHEAVRLAFPLAFEAALDIGDLEEADRLVELLATRPRGEVPPFLRAQVTRARALIAGARGEDDAVEGDLVAAEATFRDLGYEYWTARTQLDRAEWLADRDRFDESTGPAAEAAATFESIGVAPMLARARAILEGVLIPATGAPLPAGS